MALAERPDIILMDLEMPVVDGWEATRRLKEDPQTRDIPIIALSAHALAGERENALAAGCNEFDTNPIEFSRYTHRVAISNRRLIAANASGVTFKYKDYRIKGPGRYKTMTLATHEFIRRFLLHVLPKGLHRIRHYGLFASTCRAENIARARELLATAHPRSKPRLTMLRQTN